MAKHDKPRPPKIESWGDIRTLMQIRGGKLEDLVGARIEMKIENGKLKFPHN